MNILVYYKRIACDGPRFICRILDLCGCKRDNSSCVACYGYFAGRRIDCRNISITG